MPDCMLACVMIQSRSLVFQGQEPIVPDGRHSRLRDAWLELHPEPEPESKVCLYTSAVSLIETFM